MSYMLCAYYVFCVQVRCRKCVHHTVKVVILTVMSPETQITSTEPKETLVMGASRGGDRGCGPPPLENHVAIYFLRNIGITEGGGGGGSYSHL